MALRITLVEEKADDCITGPCSRHRPRKIVSKSVADPFRENEQLRYDQ